ncbi:MAG: endonuclease [bacterium]|nr:endonuclease [bacterium]
MNIPLTKGRVAIVDKKDYDRCMQFKWHSDIHTRVVYGRSRMNGKKVRLHRFILGLTDPKIITDHIDGNGLNNRRSNLRVCSMSQNNAGKRNGYEKATSKYKGVYWNKGKKKWHTAVTFHYKRKHVGYYDSEIKAAEAYNKEVLIIWGEFAVLNKI